MIIIINSLEFSKFHDKTKDLWSGNVKESIAFRWKLNLLLNFRATTSHSIKIDCFCFPRKKLWEHFEQIQTLNLNFLPPIRSGSSFWHFRATIFEVRFGYMLDVSVFVLSTAWMYREKGERKESKFVDNGYVCAWLVAVT